METRLLKTTGYLFCLLGLFFFIKNFPIMWHLNSVSYSQHLKVESINDELLFWIKFLISFSTTSLSPMIVGLLFLSLKPNTCEKKERKII
jgi:hypothetical protein